MVRKVVEFIADDQQRWDVYKNGGDLIGFGEEGEEGTPVAEVKHDDYDEAMKIIKGMSNDELRASISPHLFEPDVQLHSLTRDDMEAICVVNIGIVNLRAHAANIRAEGIRNTKKRRRSAAAIAR